MLKKNRQKQMIIVTLQATTLFCLSLGFFFQNQTRIFLIGDSTMADKILIDNPEHGWGQSLPVFFSEGVQVFNHARNGRSTKNFISEGRWKTVVDQLQEGDYVFIQFGHNDAKKDDPKRFVAPRPDYKNNLLKFVRETREKKAVPVLLTPVTRREFDTAGQYVGMHEYLKPTGDYPAAMKEVAKEENVPLIDTFEKSKQLVKTLGGEASKTLYLAGTQQQQFPSWHGKLDNTHFSRSGAFQMASIVADGIKELKLPLARYLVEDPAGTLVGTGKRVGLDYYFNNEWRPVKDSVPERFHYIWEDTTNSGFSILGRSIDLLGADLDTLQSAPTDSALKKFSVYIIVDPDTPAETKNPQYITEESVVVIERWVKNGGVLALFANDKGNCEFEHLNKLAERFSIHFNEDSQHKVIGKAWEMGKNDHLPDHPIFKNVKQIYTKEISTLTLSGSAQPILTEGNFILMASAKVGKGLVFAVGDPWLYNEYMDTRRLPADYENAKAGRNLFQWLLKNAGEAVSRR